MMIDDSVGFVKDQDGAYSDIDNGSGFGVIFEFRALRIGTWLAPARE